MDNLQNLYRFVINGVDPDTQPISHLAEYMRSLASIMGNDRHVTFVRIEPGSTTLVVRVGANSAPTILKRIAKIGQGKHPEFVQLAINKLSQRLMVDRAFAELRDADDAILLKFFGSHTPPPLVIPPFTQKDSLDGVLVRIGGKTKKGLISVHLKNRDVLHVCKAPHDIAQRLATHIYGATLRVTGEARWASRDDASWKMLRFKITDFKTLDDTPLGQSARELQSIAKKIKWADVEDPVGDILRSREIDEDI